MPALLLACAGPTSMGLHVAGTEIHDANEKDVRLLGVNRSGSEYACAQGFGIFDGPVDDASIAAIKTVYEMTDLKSKLARWHRDVDHAFYGWNDAWLDPQFRAWDISESLAYIRVPIAILQGADDHYGTSRQIEIAQEECYCPVDVTIIAGAAHSPHREAADVTLATLSCFINDVMQIDAS